jgi:hypothetical protein
MQVAALLLATILNAKTIHMYSKVWQQSCFMNCATIVRFSVPNFFINLADVSTKITTDIKKKNSIFHCLTTSWASPFLLSKAKPWSTYEINVSNM